jgi:signal transduction histidine kinase
LGIISAKINGLKLRHRLALGFTLSFTVVTAAAFIAIYGITEHDRREAFYRRLSNKTISSFKILLEVNQISADMMQVYDKNVVSSLQDLEMFLFDTQGNILYQVKRGTDEAAPYPPEVLEQLKQGEKKVEMVYGNKELMGMPFVLNDKTYYGIAFASDTMGKEKTHFLGYLLFGTFLAIELLVIITSFYLSKLITKPVTRLTEDIDKISPEDLSIRIQQPSSTDEVAFLARRFNELLNRVESAFKFQYHFMHHVSHELKTPLAVMIANAEKAMSMDNKDDLHKSLEFQKNAMMELSHIINAMIDVSKTEHQLQDILTERIRIDELLFECMDELPLLYGKAQIDFNMGDDIDSSSKLMVKGSTRMLKIALMNLLKNASYYYDNKKITVELASADNTICLNILNSGNTIPPDEQPQLFRHLFRGQNGRHVKGFGLGLVLVQRIAVLHHGSIEYSTRDSLNCFAFCLPHA